MSERSGLATTRQQVEVQQLVPNKSAVGIGTNPTNPTPAKQKNETLCPLVALISLRISWNPAKKWG